MSRVLAESKNEGLSEKDGSPRRSIDPFSASFLLVAAALSPVLTIWAGNVGLVPKLERLVLVGVLYLVVGAGVFWLSNRWSEDSRVAAFCSFFALLGLTSGGEVLAPWPWVWRWVGVAAVLALVFYIVVRLQERQLLDILLRVVAAVLLIPPLITGISAAGTGDVESVPTREDTGLRMASRPDIALIVLDGYTSLPVLRHLYGFEDLELKRDLARGEVDIVEPAITPYSMTHLTISSLLELEYVDQPRAIDGAHGNYFSQLIGGDNRLVALLRGNGYKATMVESGWHMSECGSAIDVCVSGPFVDESVDAVLSQSMLWSLVEPAVGSAFTTGALHSMEWTTTNIGRLIDNGAPDFLFVHVVAPHPPLFLDSECRIVPERRRRMTEFSEVTSVDSTTAKARLSGYVDQVRCVNRFLRDLADAVAGSTMVIFATGDHGSDALSQLAVPPSQWTQPQLIDRMGTFLAVKAPAHCEAGPGIVTTSVFRSLVACAGGVDLDPIEDKAFITSRAFAEGTGSDMRILDDAEVGELGACLERLGSGLVCP